MDDKQKFEALHNDCLSDGIKILVQDIEKNKDASDTINVMPLIDPKTGVVWLTGDKHIPNVEGLFEDGGADRFDHDHVCVCACPSSVDVNPSDGTHGDATRLIARHWNQVFGVMDVHGSEYVEIKLISVNTGRTMWSGKVLAGSNALTYPEIEMTI